MMDEEAMRFTHVPRVIDHWRRGPAIYFSIIYVSYYAAMEASVQLRHVPRRYAR